MARIGLQIESNDRDCRRHLPDSLDSRGGGGEDDIGLSLDEIGREVRQPIRVVRRVAKIDRNVLSLDIAISAQALLERLEDPGELGAGRRRSEECYSGHGGRALRLGCEWHSEGTGQRGQQEAASVHAGMVGQARGRSQTARIRGAARLGVAGTTLTTSG
jgi:hypothetical protein